MKPAFNFLRRPQGRPAGRLYVIGVLPPELLTGYRPAQARKVITGQHEARIGSQVGQG
jgi:hypothetical protein